MTKAIANVVPRGVEGGDPADLLLPKLILLQGLSKLVTREGMEVGTFVNSLSMEQLGKEVEFIPVVMVKYFDLLKQDGTKMVFESRVFDKDDPKLANRRMFPEGDLKANCNAVLSYICLIKGEPTIITFSKSSYKTGKKLYTMTKMSQKDIFTFKYKLSSKMENKKDNDFYAMEIERLGPVPEAEFKMAEELYGVFGNKVHELHAEIPADDAEPIGASKPIDTTAKEAVDPKSPASQGELNMAVETKPAPAAVRPVSATTTVRVIKEVRTEADFACPACGEKRTLREGTVKAADPETGKPWGKVKALICVKCNKLDPLEKLPD